MLPTVSTICCKGCIESYPNILRIAENPGAPGPLPGHCPWTPVGAYAPPPHTPGVWGGNKVACYFHFDTSYYKT